VNHITMTGEISLAGSLHQRPCSGAILHFHISDNTENFGNVWFIVRAQGKLAERIESHIWEGNFVTVFGRLEENMVEGSPAIIIAAKDVIPHFTDAIRARGQK